MARWWVAGTDYLGGPRLRFQMEHGAGCTTSFIHEAARSDFQFAFYHTATNHFFRCLTTRLGEFPSRSAHDEVVYRQAFNCYLQDAMWTNGKSFCQCSNMFSSGLVDYGHPVAKNCLFYGAEFGQKD